MLKTSQLHKLSHKNSGNALSYNHYMKSIFFTVTLCSFGVISFAQENNSTKVRESKNIQPETTPSNETTAGIAKPVFIDTGNPEKDRLAYEAEKYVYYVKIGKEPNPNEQIYKDIEIINGHIAAIKSKMEYVRSDVEAEKTAKEKGWFKDMDQTILNLEAKKIQLEESIDPRF